MRVKPDDVFIGSRQRREYGVAEMEELAADLKENGQIQPIAIRPPNEEDKAHEDYKDQPWILIAGGRRLMAAAMLEWDSIEAYAREEMSSLVANILELHENIKRKPMTWQEQVDAKAEIARLRRLENPDISDKEIARELGESVATFSRDLKTAELLESNPSLRKAGSKHRALTSGKLLEESAARTKQKVEAAKVAAALVPLEKRVRTAAAQDFIIEIPTASVDLTLIDGPYGYNYWTQGHRMPTKQMSEYDDSPETVGPLYRALFPQLVRTTRLTGWLVCFCGKETYDFLEELAKDCCAIHASYRHDLHSTQCEAVVGQPNPAEPCRFLVPNAYPWIWHRTNSRSKPRYPHLHTQCVTELILVINMGKARLRRQDTTNLLAFPAEYGSQRVHNNQKPLGLCGDLIERFTYKGDTVADYFFGRGSTLIAAASLGRIPWGCDKNPSMLQFALSGIREHEQAVLPSQLREAQERHARELAQGWVEVEPEEVEEVPTEGPRGVARAADKDWSYEIFRVGAEYIGYFRYDGHNMGQRRGTDRDVLEGQMIEGCEILDGLSSMGKLDPCCCTPEESMEALKEAQTI